MAGPTSSNPFYADVSGAFMAPFEGMQQLRRGEQVMRGADLEMAQMSAEGPLRVQQMRLANQKAEGEMAKKSDLAALFGSQTFDPNKPLSAQALEMAQRVGPIDFNLASQYLGLSDKFALNEARQGLAEAREAEARAKALERNHNFLYSIMGDLQTPEAYEARRMELLSSPGLVTTAENRALLENTPFEAYRAFPQIVEMERKRAMQRVAETNAKTGQQRAAAVETNSRTLRAGEVRRQQAQDAKARDEGTKPVTDPNKTRIDDAMAYLRNTPEGKSLGGVVLRNAAADIASRAQIIRQRNPAISLDVARVQALEQLKRIGAFKEEETAFGGKKWGYNSVGIGVTPRTSMPSGAAKRVQLPADLKGFRPDPNTIYLRGTTQYRYDAERGGLVRVQ